MIQTSAVKPSAPVANENFRVLVAEAEATTARLIVGSLSAVKLDCVHATDGPAALEIFQKTDPHLAILDMSLPRSDGNAVCSRIRAGSMIPIIMLNAQDSIEQQVQSFKIGADDYISKPVNPRILVARVVAALRRAYRYDTCPDVMGMDMTASEGSEGGSTPPGWATCERCGYMGPRQKFEYEDKMGRRSMRCPVCKESDFVAYSLG